MNDLAALTSKIERDIRDEHLAHLREIACAAVTGLASSGDPERIARQAVKLAVATEDEIQRLTP